MKEIEYKFVDGTVSKVLVEDSFYDKYMDILAEEELNERKETRRHTSLDYLEEKNIQFDSLVDVFEEVSDNADKEAVLTKIRQLSPKEKNIFFRYFCLGQNQQQIADDLGVCQKTISNVLFSKFRKSFY